jgi:RNA polymerase sigma-70 factor (ECF subfamily)
VAAKTFADLLRAAQNGDEAAFNQLFRQTQPSLVKFLIVVAGPDLADDIAADTWVNVVRDLDRFVGEEIGAFRAWTLAIGRRRWVDEMRRRGRRPELLTAAAPEVETATDAATEVETGMSTERAIALVSSLPPDQAEVLMLRIIADLDVGQTAQIVGKSPGAVRVLAHRGLRRLHALLGSDVTEDVTKSDPGAVDG